MRLSAQGERLRISAPKGALTAGLRDAIARHKSEILRFLAQGNARATVDEIRCVTSGEPSPLSFAQERLWFLEQLEPNSAVFNLCRAFRIVGALDVAALQASFNEMLRRQQSLRAMFIAVDGIPAQRSAALERFDIARSDLRPLAKTEREDALRRLILAEAQRPFDLASGRLLRVRLISVGEDDHVLVLSTHHIAADAWSMGILTRDLWRFYEDYSHGRVPRAAAPRCQYRDYAVWQRQRLRGSDLGSQLDYWKKHLADSPTLDLPTDRPRPLRPSFRGARFPLEIGSKLTAALGRLARRENATPFMTLLAAFDLLLFRYSGQEDLVVGAPVANRDRAELENLIGLFVNTLPLRVDLSGAPSFRELLRRVREVCLDAYANQEIPFERIVAALQPERAWSRHPLFQTMLVLQNTPPHWAPPRGFMIEPLEIDSETAQFDLSLYLRERGGRLLGYFEYATELFDDATIRRMAVHFQNLLQRIVEDPEESIAALEMMSAAERHRVLVKWNDTRTQYPDNACIHHLFEAQVERTPEAVALEYAGKKWTYRELNRQANRLAERLLQIGIGPEKLVGVMMERSPAMVVSLLAILKAGGAYVPLDPAYPRERLSFMIKDAEVGIFLTQKEFADKFADRVKRVVAVDELPVEKEGAKSNVNGGATPDHAAYVIYTSGSTGQPKGVVGLHRGAINRLAWMWKTYPFAPGEKSCAKTSLGFVDAVWEIFGALLQGVPTVIVPDAIAKDPELLARDLRRQRVTRLVLVPSLLRAMVDSCTPLWQRLTDLKLCISSGEALSAALAARFRKALPRCRLINLYGSSEVAGDATCYDVGADDVSSTIPIGKPIANTQIYLLDRRLQPVPLGARGEIYIGGENLARGYFRRPELTAERFISNPFGGAEASRLYRSGDLARYRRDGHLEFLGRVDDQVKIRGWRIEPGEVEAALHSHPAVSQSVVVAIAENPKPVPSTNSGQALSHVEGCEIENPKLDRQLIAYVVPRHRGLLPGELRAFLEARLPEAMIPQLFAFVDGLPSLPNGKVDRRNLPPVNAPALDPSRGSGEPQTEIEKVVAAVWEEVLKADDVGAQDNFFNLGGHSLLAAQAAARLRIAFDKPISLRDFFSAPTVAGLAALIEKTMRGEQIKELPPISPAPRKRFKPLSLAQERLFLFAQLFGGGDFLNMPYAYRLTGRLDEAALKKSLDEMAGRQEALRSYFVEYPDGPVRLVRRRMKIFLPLIDLSSHPQNERQQAFEQISREDAARSFDLEKAPLWRVKLIRLAPEEHILLVTLHHMISDQWSMAVMRRELAALYRAFSRGLPSPLPELPVQYFDFVGWQRELLRRGLLDRQIEYWRKQLAKRPAPLIFHLARKPTRGARFHSGRHPIEIDADLTKRIQAFAARQSSTPFMILVAALNVLLHRYTGQSDIPVGTLTANRERAGTEALIGYFVNALVLRTQLHPGMKFLDLLQRVRNVCLEAYAHQDLPFEHLETCLQTKQRPGDAPLYQVMLNYRNFSAPADEANGLTITPWNSQNRAPDPGIAISRLDLNIHLRQIATRITGAIHYKIDLFDRAAISDLVADYLKILTRLLEQPDLPLTDVK